MNQQKPKRKRTAKIVLLIAAFLGICFVLSILIPVKISIQSAESIDAEAYIIAYRIPSGSTDAGGWICVGDQDGMFEESLQISTIDGALPEDTLARHIWDSYTKFVFYGTLTQETDDEWGYRYTMHSTGWDIFGEIKYPFIGSHRFITIYDLKWMDRIDDFMNY